MAHIEPYLPKENENVRKRFIVGCLVGAYHLNMKGMAERRGNSQAAPHLGPMHGNA